MFHIRWMIRRDMNEVLDIAARNRSGHDHDSLLHSLRQRNCIGMVVEKNDRILGFMVYELHKNYLRVLVFQVHPEETRCGIGTAMINKLKEKLSGQRRRRIVLWVDDSNLTGHLFLKSQGFVADECKGDEYHFSYTIKTLEPAF